MPPCADADAASSNSSLIRNEQTRILLHLQQVLMEAIQKIIARGFMHHSSLPLLARAVRRLSPVHPPVDPSVPLRPPQEPAQQHADHQTQQVPSEMLMICQELRCNALQADLSSHRLAATPLSFTKFVVSHSAQRSGDASHRPSFLPKRHPSRPPLPTPPPPPPPLLPLCLPWKMTLSEALASMTLLLAVAAAVVRWDRSSRRKGRQRRRRRRAVLSW